MRPKKSQNSDLQLDLFRNELVNIISPTHPLVTLAEVVNWTSFEETLGELYSEVGRPGAPTRLMVALHFFKFQHDLSDDETLAQWLENPYWQHFSGMKFFEHELPIDSSSMTNWRKRVGEAGGEKMLQERIEAGLRLKVVKESQLERVNVDTTVQEKNIRFPTDSRLYDRARTSLVSAARERGIDLRQSYARVGRNAMIQQSRYARARQYGRAKKCAKSLKNFLGRVIRDIWRKCPSPDENLRVLLEISEKIHNREKNDKNKIYSVHEPHVECICKGKAHKRYEFGNKVSVAVTSKGGWFVGAKSFHGNPYDGHTLSDTILQVVRISGSRPDHVFVDQGYKGHDYSGEAQVHVDRKHRGSIPKSLWRWMKRRAAVEPSIGHLKEDHRMDRNRLKGIEGDQINAILSAAAMNFSKLLNHLAAFLRLFLGIIANIACPQERFRASYSPL